MKILLYIFLTTSSFSIVHAQSYDPAVATILGQINSMTNAQNSCMSFATVYLPYAGKTKLKVFQNCALALCGPSENNPTALVTDLNFSKQATNETLLRAKKLRPTIKDVIEKKRASKIYQLNALKNALQADSLEKVDFSTFPTYVRAQTFSEVFDKYVTLTVDHEKDMQNRVGVNYNFPEWADDNFKKVAKEYGESFKRLYTNRWDFIKSKSIYSNEEIRKILSEKLILAEKFITENQSDKNIETYKKMFNETKKNVEENLPLSYQDFNNMSALTYTYFPDDKNPSHYINCMTEECSSALKSYLQNEVTRQRIDALIADASDESGLEKEINKCTAGLIANSIKGGNQKIAEQQFKKAMDAIEKNVLPMFSNHSRELLLKSLKQLKVNVSKLPGTSSIFSESNFLEESKKYLKDSGKPDITSSPSKLVNSLMKAMGENFFEENPCQKTLATNVWDATNTDKKIVYVSDYSCSHDMRGQQIVAHEIGHNINHLFAKLPNMSQSSLKSYTDIRKCIAKNYPTKKGNADALFKSDTSYTEEDMADFISNLAYSENDDLFACALLSPDTQTNSYSAPDLWPDTPLDVHSTGLLRALLENIQKGKPIPLSCQEAMNEYSEKLGFNKCRN